MKRSHPDHYQLDTEPAETSHTNFRDQLSSTGSPVLPLLGTIETTSRGCRYGEAVQAIARHVHQDVIHKLHDNVGPHGWAVWRALDSLAVNRELMRGWLYSGDLPAKWAGWVDGER